MNPLQESQEEIEEEIKPKNEGAERLAELQLMVERMSVREKMLE